MTPDPVVRVPVDAGTREAAPWDTWNWASPSGSSAPMPGIADTGADPDATVLNTNATTPMPHPDPDTTVPNTNATTPLPHPDPDTAVLNSNATTPLPHPADPDGDVPAQPPVPTGYAPAAPAGWAPPRSRLWSSAAGAETQILSSGPTAGGSPVGLDAHAPDPFLPPGAHTYSAPPRSFGPGWPAVIAVAAATGVLAAVLGAGAGAYLADSGWTDRFDSAPTAGRGATERPTDSIAAVAARALPSVVTIRTGSESGGSGSGFVYDDDGHIVTNNHVVEALGDDIVVVLSNGQRLEATVVGTDPAYDLAVLDTARTDLAPLTIGSSADVVVGDEVIAVGAPLGLASTVTSGIVSAVNRPVVAGGSSSRSYINAIQTDAAINPGNSGGPLLDMSGAVIGVNSAIAQPPGTLGGGGGSIGLGFAIPSDQAKKTADELIADGSAEHPIIGVMLDLTFQGPGARVQEAASGDSEPVTPGGPADRAGLEPGDVIVGFDGKAVGDADDLIVFIRARDVGDSVPVTVRRGGKTIDVTMTLQASPAK